MYDATLGRFLQRDPLEYAAGDVNLYAYVSDNPLNRVDLLGEVDYGNAKVVDPAQFDTKKLGPQHQGLQYDEQKKAWVLPGYGYGQIYEVKTDAGTVIYVYKVTEPMGNTDEEKKRRSYYCHSLTFGGKEAKGGPYLPSDSALVAILKDEWTEIPCKDAKKDDIAVWYNARGLQAHSATFAENAKAGKGADIDPSTTFRTKNHWLDEYQAMTLEDINKVYPGNSIKCYKRKKK